MVGTLLPPIGYSRAARYTYIATAGQTTFSGPDSNGVTLVYTPGFVEVAVNGLWLPPSDYTATNGSAVVTPGALSAGDIVYVWVCTVMAVGDAIAYTGPQTLTDAQKAQARDNAGVQKKNYIINGAMMVSQENGATAGTTNAYFPVDQFYSAHSNAGTQTFQQVASVTPSGSPNRLRVTATAADASVAAGDYCVISQTIEGLRVADLRSGSASAKTITIRFGVKAPAGTYSVILRNSAATRGYSAEYTISSGEANTDVVKSVTIALDQSGTWLADTGAGISILWALMCGTTFQQSPNAWAAGNFLGSSNQFNFMGTINNVFELFDVGLYEGSVAPPFVVPDYPSELALCQRYLRKALFGVGVAYSTTAVRLQVPHDNMRAAPTASLSAVANITDIYTANPTQSSASVTIFSNSANIGQYDLANYSGLTTGRMYLLLPTSTPILLNARL